MKNSLLKLIFLPLFLFLSTALNAYSPQYENQIIDAIEVTIIDPSGMNRNPNSVRMLIKSREGDHFSQAEFDQDLKSLAKEFYRIDPYLQSIEGKMHISLKVWPKPIIRHIKWEGNEKMGTQFLQKELDISPGTPFDRQLFNQAFHKLKLDYVKKGFFEAQLDYTVSLDPETHEVDILVAISEGRAGMIRDILFRNFTDCEEEELLNTMLTKKYNFFTGWLSGEGIYNQEALEQDRFAIINFLQNQGYADADAKIEFRLIEDMRHRHTDECTEYKESAEADQIVLFITADKGICYNFGPITIEGNVLYSEEELRKIFTIAEGSPYNPEALRNTARNIMDYYGLCGYIDTYVDYEPHRVSPEEFCYSVHFKVQEGEQYHVGMIKVFGNCSTETRVLLHEVLLTPGDVFNIAKLQRTEQRLQYTGLFKSVNVYAVKSEGIYAGLEGNYRDVHIEVEETSTGNFGASLGFSTVENAFAGFNLTERNFNISGFTRLFKDGMGALRGGGEYANFTANVGKKSRSYILSWSKPHFLDSQWTVGFDLDYTTNGYISDDYDIHSEGGNVHTSYQYNPFSAISWHYRLKHSRVEIPGTENNIKLRAAKETSGLIGGFGTSLIYNTTNHPTNPTCGYKGRLELEYASLSRHRSFFGYAFLNSYYYEIARQHVLKFRGDFRLISLLGNTDFDDLPLDERFFLGGDNNLRGYRSYKLGPKFKEVKRDNDGNPVVVDGVQVMQDTDEPKGGISLQLFSAEYIYTPLPIAELFAFADIGHLTDSQWTFGGHYYTSAGIGARLYVMGDGPPVTIGYGFPFNPQDRSERKNFFLTIGGRF